MSFYYRHLTSRPLDIPVEMLDGDVSISIISNFISEYFYQKYCYAHKLDFQNLVELVGDPAHIQDDIYKTIDHPDNYPNENDFLIDVYSDLLDFTLNLKEYSKDLEEHQKGNLYFAVTNMIGIDKWDTSIIPIIKNHPEIATKMQTVLSSWITLMHIHFTQSLELLNIDTNDTNLHEDVKLLKPFQDKLLHSYLNAKSKNYNKNYGILHLQKFLGDFSSHNHFHLLEELNSFSGIDCSTLFNGNQQVSETEFKAHLYHASINNNSEKTIEPLVQFFNYFNTFDFNTNHSFPEQKIFHGTKILISPTSSDNVFCPNSFQALIKVEHENPSLAYAITKELMSSFYHLIKNVSNESQVISYSSFNQNEQLRKDKKKIISSSSFKGISHFNQAMSIRVREDMLTHKMNSISTKTTHVRTKI